MAIFQRTLTAAVAAAALAGSFALSAQAQPAPAQPAAAAAHAAPQHAPRHAQAVDLAKVHAERSERLKTLLQLQPNQQAAWDQYVKATTPQPRAKPQGERKDLRQLTTPERLDLAQQLRKERTAKVEQREQATRSFYSSLNPSQQKAFDTLSAHQPDAKRGHGKHFAQPRGPHHGHGHPGQHRAAPSAPAAPAA